MDMKVSMEVVAFLISVVNVVAGFLLWYSANVTKSYAAKRDFEHLKRHYEQLATNQGQILKELDEMRDAANLELRDIKHNLSLIVMRFLPEVRPPKQP